MRSSKLSYLDLFDEFDPLGKNQCKYDLMAELSINEDRLGEETTELSGGESEWDDLNGDINVFDLFEGNDD